MRRSFLNLFRSVLIILLLFLSVTLPVLAGEDTQLSYKIEYVLNGPEDDSWDAVTNPPENPDSYSPGDSIRLKKPTREGYSFGGWYKDAALTKKITKIKKNSTGDLCLYAKWTENKYTVVFKANGGKGRMKKLRGTAAADLKLPSCAFSYAAHGFRSWKSAKLACEEGLEFGPEGTIKAGSVTGRGEKLVLYAQWDNNAAVDLYVSTEGNDENDGSEDRPFRSIQHALDQAQPGSTVHVKAGIYDECLSFPRSGEKTDPITLMGEPAERTEEEEWKLKCPSVLTYSGSDESITLMDINGQSDICIRDLDIGNISCKYACGIYIPENSKNIRIENCRIHDIRVAEPYLCSPEENEDAAGEANAILCFGEGTTAARAVSRVHICYNEICDNVTNWSEAVSAAGNVSHICVLYNQVHDNTNIGIDFNGNTGYCPKPKLDQPRFCEARGNTVYNCHCEYAYCAGIYVDGARDTLLADNTVHHCDYGMEVGAEIKKDKYPVKNITVKGNYLHDNLHGGLWIGGYDPENSGIVKKTKIVDNHLKDNGSDPDTPEVEINRCAGVLFQGNTFEVSRPPEQIGHIIVAGMGKKYTSGLKFKDNVFITELPEEERIWIKE
ncbi:MAG: InlB B-repeat-containing protein [Lachnospiraceae bacterium]|nr:InlB B-repeat-containing protein [Lachnospiraceae bacterium]